MLILMVAEKNKLVPVCKLNRYITLVACEQNHFSTRAYIANDH